MISILLMLGVVAVSAIGIVHWWHEMFTRPKEIDDAKKAYQESLFLLRNKPNDAPQRQETLELGRVYSNLSRHSKGVAIFDEIALKNDIDAACAGAVTMTQSDQHVAAQPVQERLSSLNGLRQSALITDVEYDERRERILNSI